MTRIKPLFTVFALALFGAGLLVCPKAHAINTEPIPATGNKGKTNPVGLAPDSMTRSNPKAINTEPIPRTSENDSKAFPGLEWSPKAVNTEPIPKTPESDPKEFPGLEWSPKDKAAGMDKSNKMAKENGMAARERREAQPGGKKGFSPSSI